MANVLWPAGEVVWNSKTATGLCIPSYVKLRVGHVIGGKELPHEAKLV